MRYNILNIILLLFLLSCANKPLPKETNIPSLKNFFLNKGFALVYDESLYKKKIVKKAIDDRSLIIFQKNLKKNTPVKITNLIN